MCLILSIQILIYPNRCNFSIEFFVDLDIFIYWCFHLRGKKGNKKENAHLTKFTADKMTYEWILMIHKIFFSNKFPNISLKSINVMSFALKKSFL